MATKEPDTSESTAEPGGDSRPVPVVVGIGASAGGLAALRTLLKDIPQETGIAFVIVVHLSPDHESHLADLLQPHARIPVLQVAVATELLADHIYVIPPGYNLDSVDTHLRPVRFENEPRSRAPIDHFLRTLAATHDGHSIAVILSGTGSDGALGIKAVKERNGLTIVQDPGEAEFDGMPQSAISTGLVDRVLPLAEIMGAILRFARAQPRFAFSPEAQDADAILRQKTQQLLALVHTRTGRDFSRYKPSTLLRRIQRRMQLHGVEDVDAYLRILREEVTEPRALADDILITVTNFFRDPETWDVLEKEVVPALFEDHKQDESIRVWSVGCATGEEAYSLAILLLEEAARHERSPRIQVFASDLHERALERAREAFYTGDIEADVSAERLRRFFHKEDGGYRLRKEVREHVVFAPHNLLKDPPFSRLDLIACRNLLIYLQRDIQGDILELFHYALRPDGILVLGTSETVDASELFRTENKRHAVFRKRNVRAPEPRLPVFPAMRAPVHPESRGAEQGGGPTSYGALHQRMVEQFAPPSMLIAPDGRVVHLSEHAGRYLVLPGGEPTASAYKLVREELRLELRSALHNVRESRRGVRSRPITVQVDGIAASVVLDVRPSMHPEQDGYALVIFEEREAGVPHPRRAADHAGPGPAGDHDREAELELTKQRLQAIIEEYETGQEEMRASHEELQSANEELRSTLEELETSKEELQSMNEELQAVNQENRHKVEELSQLSSDLQNLLSSTQIATLFLDRELRILRFTPQVGELFNVRPVDRGRPLSDLTHRLGYDEIGSDAEAVLRNLTPIDREVRDERGQWYLTRVLPYRSAQDRIEGVVITFVDITAQKLAEQALRESEERFRTVVDLIPDLVWRADAAGAATWYNRRWYEYTGQTPNGALGAGWADATHPDDRERWRQAFANSARGATTVKREHRIRSLDGAYRWFLVRMEPVVGEDGRVQQWFGAATDVHEHRTLLATLEQRVEQRTAEVRRLASTLTMAEQEERRRISQLLHDDLQQLLYGIQMNLAATMERAEQGNTSSLLEQTARSLTLLEEAITRTRQLTVDLSPPVLEGEGLVDALQWLQTQMRDLYGMHVDVRGPARLDVEPRALRILLYQVVRELLFNVAKHAQTKRAHVEVDTVDGSVRIAVVDEGRGFDPKMLEEMESSSLGGFGIFSVRERVRLHGGDVEIQSEPGAGTRVIIYAPVSSRSNSITSRKDSER